MSIFTEAERGYLRGLLEAIPKARKVRIYVESSGMGGGFSSAASTWKKERWVEADGSLVGSLEMEYDGWVLYIADTKFGTSTHRLGKGQQAMKKVGEVFGVTEVTMDVPGRGTDLRAAIRRGRVKTKILKV